MGEIIEKHLILEFKNQTYITVCIDLYCIWVQMHQFGDFYSRATLSSVKQKYMVSGSNPRPHSWTRTLALH